MRFPCLIITALVCSAASSSARVLRVNPKATGSTHDGAAWNTAYLKVQDAVGASAAGDEIWVAAGAYPETVTIGSSVSLYGGFAGTETLRDLRKPASIESAFSGGIVLVTGATSEARVDGFTFRNSAGVESTAGSLTVSGNVFVTGHVQQTGGSIALTGNAFGGQRTAGAAIVLQYATVTVADNTIRQRDLAAAVSPPQQTAEIALGALYIAHSSGSVTGNIIAENSLDGGSGAVNSFGGGAGLCAISSTLYVAQNVIALNRAALTGSTASNPEGGGLRFRGGTLILANNLIAGNELSIAGPKGTAYGAGAVIRDATAYVVNNTVVDNIVSSSGAASPASRGGGLYVVTPPSSPAAYTLQNNIVAFNPSGVDWSGAQPSFGRNCVWGNGANFPAGAANVDPTGMQVDPVFSNRPAADYHLAVLSPCVDAGADAAVRGSADLDGRFRILGAHVDMGAYETPVSAGRTVADAARALRLAAGLTAATPFDIDRLNATGADQTVDLRDAVRALRLATH
ncbi:MAG TPA: choice-of-anchor Q domain-containing protein [Armatimonadota bacterium]|jgi:hypothetical protein